MNTKALNALAGVICRAQEQDRTPMGIAFAVDSAGLHMSPETAAELERLRARVAELEAGRAAVLDDFIARCEVALSGCCSECDAAAAIVKGRKQAALDSAPVPEWSADKLTALFAPTQALREDEPTKCRCDEPGADPYACEADDCRGEFSELNPFGGGPVHGHDAKVSRTCKTCGWETSVWHVDDGSAEEELHSHVARIHGGAS